MMGMPVVSGYRARIMDVRHDADHDGRYVVRFCVVDQNHNVYSELSNSVSVPDHRPQTVEDAINALMGPIVKRLELQKQVTSPVQGMDFSIRYELVVGDRIALDL